MNPTAAAQLGIQLFDAADYLQSDEDCAQYLQACIDEAPEDAALFTKAGGDIARARGMMQLARDTGITREGFYKALGEQGNPHLCDGRQSQAPARLAVQCGGVDGAELSAL